MYTHTFTISIILFTKIPFSMILQKAFGPEIIALSWLQWFRKRLVNKRAPGKPPGCFSEGFNSPRDLFNILSYQYYSRDYPELEKVVSVCVCVCSAEQQTISSTICTHIKWNLLSMYLVWYIYSWIVSTPHSVFLCIPHVQYIDQPW